MHEAKENEGCNGCYSNGCEDNGCSCSECQHKENNCYCHDMEMDMEESIMHLAKKAKFELLKEKMKRRLEAIEGRKLDEIADLVVDTMVQKHRIKEEILAKEDELYEKWNEMSEKMNELFSKDSK